MKRIPKKIQCTESIISRSNHGIDVVHGWRRETKKDFTPRAILKDCLISSAKSLLRGYEVSFVSIMAEASTMDQIQVYFLPEKKELPEVPHLHIPLVAVQASQLCRHTSRSTA